MTKACEIFMVRTILLMISVKHKIIQMKGEIRMRILDTIKWLDKQPFWKAALIIIVVILLLDLVMLFTGDIYEYLKAVILR